MSEDEEPRKTYGLGDPKKYGLGDTRRYGLNPPKAGEEAQPNAAPPPPPVNTEAIERAACRAVGLPHPIDIENGTETALHHHLGTFIIAHSEGATLAAVKEFRFTCRNDFLTLGEYKNALRQIDKFQTQRRKDPWALNEKNTAFLQFYSVDRYRPELRGYLNYIRDHVPELNEVLHKPIEMHTPEDPRRTHTYVLGTTGSGKTELLKALIYSYARQPKSASVVVIEPSGDFVKQVANWPEFIGNDRLMYLKLDLRPGMVPTINPLEISNLDPLDTSREAVALKQVVAQQLLSALEGILGGRSGGDVTTAMRAILMSCLLVLLEKPGATLLDLQRFMDKDNNADLVEFGASRAHFQSASTMFSGPFNGTNYDITRRSIYTKLQTLFDISFFTELTCGKTTIDLEAALNSHKIILFDLEKGKLGDDASAAFARLMIAMIQAIAKRRGDTTKTDRVPIHLIVDECHNYLISTVEEILAESRKFALYLTLCQQNAFHEMSQSMAKMVANNTTVKIAGKAQPGEYTRSAQMFPIRPEAMEGMSRSGTKGLFYIRAGEGDTFQFKARSDLVDFRHRMTPELWKITCGKQIRAYYRSVADRPDEAPPTAPTSATSPVKRRTKKLE